MKEHKETNTEQLILKCAEEVFLERGFDGAKTTEIAKRAGVNHAMLHYYFRTKQNLFDVIFKNKVELFATSFSNTLAQELPLFDKIRQAIELHFDFIAQNPRLPFFLYTEIINNDERKLLFINTVKAKVENTIIEFDKSLSKEIEKGNIRKIDVTQLLLNIIALNVTTFMAYPIIETLIENEEERKKLIETRKKNNVEFIINSIRLDPDKPKYVQTSLNFDM